MDPEYHQKAFQKAVSSIKSSMHLKKYNWEIEVIGDDIYLKMMLKGNFEKSYILRVRCDNYPQEIPSFLFVNPITKEEDLSFWPNGNAFKKEWPGICINGTREFYQPGKHSERRDRWSPEKYPILQVLQEIQVLLK